MGTNIPGTAWICQRSYGFNHFKNMNLPFWHGYSVEKKDFYILAILTSSNNPGDDNDQNGIYWKEFLLF